MLFFILLILLLLLLSLFRKCDCPDRSEDRDMAELPLEDRWKTPLPGAEDVGLPPPEDNYLPPFENPVPDPDNGGATEIYPNLLYVILDSDTDDETFKMFAERFTTLYEAPAHKIEFYNTKAKTMVLSVPEESRAEICKTLPSRISEVEFLVVPVEVMTSFLPSDDSDRRMSEAVTPDDPAFSEESKSWYFKPIQAQEAWSITRGSEDVIVGIVDSYMDLTHPELKSARCISPYSVERGDENVAAPPGTEEPSASHGTLVTSIAVGNADNREGSSGIAPGCRFIPVSMGKNINTVTMVEGLLYCMYNNASVINLSCGTYFKDEIINMSIDDQISFSKEFGRPAEEMWDYVFSLAEKRNVTIVWAAGNQNCYDAMDVSKRNPNTIRVSAVGKNLQKADFSNYGNFPSRRLNESTISAPGVDIWGARPGNSYDAWQGTSFSAPIITGVVALMKSVNPDLSNSEIISILQTTGQKVKGGTDIGNIVQIKDALLMVDSAS